MKASVSSLGALSPRDLLAPSRSLELLRALSGRSERVGQPWCVEGGSGNGTKQVQDGL